MELTHDRTSELASREDEHRAVIDWRLGELLRVGYETAHAEKIAACVRIDLHYACDLVVVRRCPHELAARILL